MANKNETQQVVTASDNILSRYRTYSYHHFLALCPNTETAELLAESDTLASFRHPDGTGANANKYAVRHLGTNTVLGLFDSLSSKVIAEKDGYVVLIDGMSDADLSIGRVKWSTNLAPTINSDAYTTIATEGDMIIMEPRGASFLNIISNSIRSLNTDPSTAIFVLKTIFVGYTNDGRSEVLPVNIAPLLFIAYDIQAQFEPTGATYSISFVPVVNGACRMPQYFTCTDGVNFNIPQKSTLEQALATIQTQMRTQYDKHFEEVKQTLAPDIKAKPILFTIKLKENCVYSDPSYVIDGYKSATSDLGVGQAGNVTISNGANSNLEQVINTVMRSCKKILAEIEGKEVDPKTQQPIKRSYKIESTLITTQSHVEVVFTVGEYILPVSPPGDSPSLLENAQKGEDSKISQNQVLHLNYYFTGQNVDILNMDIKMAMGLYVLQTISTQGILKDSSTDNQSAAKNVITNSKGPVANDVEKRSVVIPMTKFDKKPSNKSSQAPLSDATFRGFLSRFAALEGLDTQVTIVGNPVFLGNLTTLPSEVASGITSKETTLFANYATVPPLCKIFIKMPSTSDNNAELTDFWYNGYYYIYGIENNFEDGLFTQNLSMMSLPSDLTDLKSDV